jgi:hypothetical protein
MEEGGIMAWEKHYHKSYYYRKIRQGDRVISHYLGAGPALEQRLREESQARQAEQQARQTLAALDADLAQLYTFIQTLQHASLLLYGYHTHHRQWRKKRNTLPINSHPPVSPPLD